MMLRSTFVVVVLLCTTRAAQAQPVVAPPPSPPAAPVPLPSPPATPATSAAEPAATEAGADEPAATEAGGDEPAATEAGGDEAGGDNLLAGLSEGGAGAGPADDSARSFGSELRLFGLEATWSGYGDLLLRAVPQARELTFDASHFNPILGVHVSDAVSAELELEIEHAGAAIKVEYALLDFTPWPALGLRLGRFLVPIGRFNEMLHPSFRWAQVSRPAMFQDVVPAVWSEVGAQLRGAVDAGGVNLDYAAYVVNGLAAGPEADAQSDFVRGLRDNTVDNNLDKGLGFRVGLGLRKGHVGATTLGLSAYTGALDANGGRRLSIFDADLAVKLGAVSISAEVAQSRLRTSWFERGAYVAALYQRGRTTLTGRWDYTGTRPLQGALVQAHGAVATVKFAPTPAWSVRGEVGVPVIVPAGGKRQLELQAAVAFVF